jgi:hypothetical protein
VLEKVEPAPVSVTSPGACADAPEISAPRNPTAAATVNGKNFDRMEEASWNGDS